MTALCVKKIFHLEHIMGEPIGPAKGTGSANRLWPPYVDHFSILLQTFDLF